MTIQNNHVDKLRLSVAGYSPDPKHGRSKHTPRLFGEAAHQQPPPNSRNTRSAAEVPLLDVYPTYIVRLRLQWFTLLGRNAIQLELPTLTEHASGWTNREPFPWLWFHARSMQDASNRYHPTDNPLPTITNYAAARLWVWSINQWLLPPVEPVSVYDKHGPKNFYDQCRRLLAKYGLRTNPPVLTGSESPVDRYTILSNPCKGGKKK